MTGCAFPWDLPESVSAPIGPEGGSLAIGDALLEIPPGALGDVQTITVHYDEPPLEGRAPIAPVVRMEPDGLVFDEPVRLSWVLPPDVTGVVMWTRLGDPTSFEVRGYASNGMAVATSTHFSTAEVDPPCDDPAHDDAHAEPEEGESEGACQEEVSGSRPCMRMCLCMAQDEAGGALCPQDPGTFFGDNCPGNPQWLTSDMARSNELLAEPGAACTGYRYVDVQEMVCSCEGDPPGAPAANEPLCPRPYTNSAPSPSVSWGCTTTVQGTDQYGRTYTAMAPMPPEYPDVALNAYIGMPGAACTGYYRPPTASSAPASIAGTLTGCSLRTVGYRWVPVSGMVDHCRPDSTDDQRRCRMSPADWETLQQRREDCGFPRRSTRDAERSEGPSDDRGSMLVTTAILTYQGADGTQEATGLSSRAQTHLDARTAAGDRPATCPEQAPITQTWTDIGRTRADGTNDNGTRWHAEGGALLRAAEAGGGSPGMPGAYSRCARMIVDRRPCSRFCQRDGIDAARRAANIRELVVQSPAGCFRYGEDLPPGGVWCDESDGCPE